MASKIYPPGFTSYKSPYGPSYKTTFQVGGLTPMKAFRYGAIIAGFGGAAGAAVLLFASDIPRFRKDIMQKIPVIGSYWVREVPPEDNPF